jgi:hypothetical protein
VFLNLQAGFCLLEASSVVNKICWVRAESNRPCTAPSWCAP